MKTMSSEELIAFRWWEQDWFKEWCRMAGLTQLD